MKYAVQTRNADQHALRLKALADNYLPNLLTCIDEPDRRDAPDANNRW